MSDQTAFFDVTVTSPLQVDEEKSWVAPSDPSAETSSVMVIACGAIARETLAVIKTNKLDHISLHCLPAILHNTPDQIPQAVRAAIHKFRAPGRQIYIGYGDCGTGGLLDKVLVEEGVERLPGAHCYAFFSGVEAFAALSEDEITSFYLTDFLARQFRAFVIEPLGLDRHPELASMYFGHYEKVVYLAQTDDDELTKRAQDAADFLGLAFERRFTGFGDLSKKLYDLTS